MISKSISFETSLQNKKLNGKKILSCYLMLGYPTLEESIKTMEKVAEYADIIEIGLPFSDPIADGPIIQHAGKIALDNDVGVKDLKNAIDRLKDKDIHIVVMTYANVFFQNPEILSFPIDSLIIPDMPVDYTPEEYLNFGTTFIISPNTIESRIIKNVKNSTGFIYLVSQLGITGSEFHGDKRNKQIIKKIKKIDSDIIILSGFGISNSEDVRYMIEQGVDGVIIGSVLIKYMDKIIPIIKEIRETLNQ